MQTYRKIRDFPCLWGEKLRPGVRAAAHPLARAGNGLYIPCREHIASESAPDMDEADSK